jgi:epoxyqueuosine reductase
MQEDLPENNGGLAERVRQLGFALGFDAVGFAAAKIAPLTAERLARWLALGRHGEMDYMARHAVLRSDPAQMTPVALNVISVRLGYLPAAADEAATLADPDRAYVARYALGRDYHKLMRSRLQTLAERIGEEIGPHGYRVCVDSAPVLEVELASHAGVGWRGKHTLLLDRHGSWSFLGELYTDLPLPPDTPSQDHCGRCRRCIDICPTGAILAPYELDARRCIAYLTIELKGAIPVEFREAIGNRIYGCDDCQLVCPWNRFAQRTREPDFAPRQNLDTATLVELFAWSEGDFNDRLAGSAIRRIGHERWLRNIAVALGNAPTSAAVIAALRARADDASALLREHVAWALARHQEPLSPISENGAQNIGCA